jgi:excisionase family DNA binding protein
MRSKPRFRKPDWRRIKIHRSYTVDEAARTLGVAKGTVRRWIKNELPALKEQKPILILGTDLIEFGRARKADKQRCKPHECYCVKCREPRVPHERKAEYGPLTATNGNLRGLCPICGTLMHKRISVHRIAEIGKILAMSVEEGETRLLDSRCPPMNDYFHLEHATNGKVSSGQ